MATFPQITSHQNSKVKLVKKLRDRRSRVSEARFVIDDARDLERALACDFEVDFALYCPELGDLPSKLDKRTEIYDVSRSIIEKVSYRQNASAIVVVMVAKPSRQLPVEYLDRNIRALVLVDLKKPGNIGALMRTADAAGFDMVILVDSALDIYNPNIIRASTGTCFLDNIYVATSGDVMRFLRENTVSVVATVIDGDRPMYEADMRGRVAVLMGTEHEGLSQEWVDFADYRVRIPMMGAVSDSLNVSVSGALVMYEVLRQRLETEGHKF